jgi:hypothetical protein
MTAQRLDRLIQQATPLVVADCFDVHPGSFRQLADAQF